jgi:quercetin dioxygenase-like cupin family protein
MIEAEGHRAVRARRETALRGREPGVRVLVAGGDTAGRLAVLEVTVVAGCEPALHLHTREDEIVYVLAGEVVIHLDGTRHRCMPGGCVVLPRGREHTFTVETDAARLLVLVVPAGFEGFYGELEQAATGATSDLERLVTVAARYGVEITGPPPGTEHDQRRTEHDDPP